MKNYITAGELAKLAGTTKRTVLWYDQIGIIKPVEISAKGYRRYLESQVLEYQMVLLLSKLGITLKEIKEYLSKKGKLEDLFELKKTAIKNEIENLKFSLDSLERFMLNLKSNQTMIKPEIKVLKPFDIYYIEKIGPYVQIGKYCDELTSMFLNKGKTFTTLSVFEEASYQPKKSKILVGALATSDTRVNPKYKEILKKMVVNPGKVITYTHNGEKGMLSLFWKQLEKYCDLNKIEIRHDIPDFEIYRKVNSNPKKQFFEIYLPIK